MAKNQPQHWNLLGLAGGLGLLDLAEGVLGGEEVLELDWGLFSQDVVLDQFLGDEVGVFVLDQILAGDLGGLGFFGLFGSGLLFLGDVEFVVQVLEFYLDDLVHMLLDLPLYLGEYFLEDYLLVDAVLIAVYLLRPLL